jgi:zinc-ribbon domain
MTEQGAASALICPDCGTRNQPGTDFCTNCGGYLAWDRTSLIPIVTSRTVAPPTVAAPAPPPPPPTPPTPDPAPVPAPALVQESPREPAPEPPPALPTGAGAPPVMIDFGEDLPPTRVLPVQRPLPPAAPAVQPGPALVQPAAPIAKPTPVAPPVMAPASAPGDIACPNCGRPNAPSRHFCAYCGTALAAVGGRTGSSGQPAAGTRPKGKRRRFPVALVVVIVLVLAGGTAAWIERSPLHQAADGILDRVAPQKPENPTAFTASSAAAGHPAALAFDGLVNTAWEPLGTGNGVGQYLVASFAQPFRLVYLQIRAGAAQSQHAFLSQGRPSSILVTMTLQDGSTVTRTITLADDPTDQQFSIGQNSVAKVQLSVLASAGATATAPLAISEVEFRTR